MIFADVVEVDVGDAGSSSPPLTNSRQYGFNSRLSEQQLGPPPSASSSPKPPSS